MTSRALLTLAVTALTLLAGCTTGDEAPSPAATDAPTARPELAADKGAIAGLVVDDAFRPIPAALVLVQELGLTARSNINGEFVLQNVDPGTYTLRVEADGHEAIPKDVDVPAGEYAEVTLSARRVVNDDGHVITQEYTVFIACSVDFVANGIAGGFCVADQSGDSGRSGFTSNYTDQKNVTYVVTEMKTNQPGRWEVQIRAANETSGATDRYAVAQFEGDYVKIVNKVGEHNLAHEAMASYGENVPFSVAWPFDTLLWTDHAYREELQGAGLPVCCGAGATFGIQARFVQSVFIGEPTVNIDAYATMSPG